MIFEHFPSLSLIDTYATISLGLPKHLRHNMCMHCIFQNCPSVHNYFNHMQGRMNFFVPFYIPLCKVSWEDNKSYCKDKQIWWLKRHKVYTSVG